MIIFLTILQLFLSQANAAFTCKGTPSNPACSQWNSDITACENFNNRGTDCTYNPFSCSGVATTPCSTYDSDPGNCNAFSPGCTFNDTNFCSGTATACSSFGDSGSCGAQSGCSWTMQTCIDFQGTGFSNCEDAHTGCIADSCNTADNTSQANCEDEGGVSTGCTYSGVEGAGTCSGDDPAGFCGGTCTSGCTVGCVGSPSDCSTFSDSGSCGAQSGCSWGGGSTSCTGTIDCSVQDPFDCGVAGCTSNTANCSGTLVCADQTPQGSTACTDIGCKWSSGTGNFFFFF